MPSYYTLVVRIDGKWSPQFGDYDLEVVEDEKMEWDDVAYDVSFFGVNPPDVKIITTSECQTHIDAEVMKLNSAS